MSEVINLTFTSVSPSIVLLPVTPSEAKAEFAQAIVGEKGDPGTAGTADNIDGFTTDPVAYYILASN